MEELLNGVVVKIGDWNPFWAYAFLLLSAFLENVIPPVPGDTVVLFSAFLVGRGVFDWAPVYAVTCAGGLGGFAVVYALGITRGRAFIEGPGRRFFSARALERVEVWLGRYGMWLIFASRFLSGVRSVIALSAGIGRLPWPRVMVMGLASMAMWNALLLYARHGRRRKLGIPAASSAAVQPPGADCVGGNCSLSFGSAAGIVPSGVDSPQSSP